MSSDIKCVAFLQNMWFRDPERMKAQLATSFKGDRESFIRTWLFWSCITGKRLKAVFGEMIDQIVWEEQSPEIGGKSSALFAPDFEHIARVLEKHQPTHVIAFGKKASDALRHVSSSASWDLIIAPHPAARHVTVMAELRFARDLLLGKFKEAVDE